MGRSNNLRSDCINPLFCAVAFFVWAMCAQAASLFPEPSDPNCDFLLTGVIEEGDAVELDRTIPASASGRILCMDSPGGDFREGIRLFHMIWNKGSVVTRVRSGEECFSACAIAFMGGSRTVGTGAIRSRQSVLEPRGALGFHAPRLLLEGGSTFSSADVQSAYALALSGLSRLLEITHIYEHQVDGMNTFLLQEILRTPPSELFYIDTVGRAALADIGIVNYILPEITWSGIRNACDTAVIKSRDDLLSLGAEDAFGALPRYGVDGDGVPMPFDDRSWSWSDGGYMHFVFRGYSAPHRAEGFCKLSISRIAWQRTRDEAPDPWLPSSLVMTATLWSDFDVPKDDRFAEYAESIDRVSERFVLSPFVLFDPKTPIAALPRILD